MMILLWNPPPDDDSDGALYFCYMVFVMAIVVIVGQMVRP